MGDNFDELWEDLDEDVIKECIFIESQTLSQAHPSAQSSNFGFQNEKKKEKAHFSKQSFPSLSSFYDDNPIKDLQNSKLQKFQPLPTSLNNKVYTAIPSKVLISNQTSYVGKQESNFQSKFNHNNAKKSNQLPQNHNEDELENWKKEKEKLVEENLIKQGEVYNLRCELKRKEASLENERVDHCLAVESAEKRGKEKSAISLKESELKVKTLQVEMEKLYGSIAFKNREVEELLARCQQLEHLHSMTAPVSKKSLEISQSSKRFKRDLDDNKKSPSNGKTNFSDRFDFKGKKCEVKDVQIQTSEENDTVTRFSLPICSKRGKMNNSKKALILAHKNHQMIRAHSSNSYSECQLQVEEIASLQFRNDVLLTSEGKFDAIESPTDLSDDYLIKSVCVQLENILTNFKKEKGNEKFRSIIKEKYVEMVSPLFDILRITPTKKEDILFDVIKTLAQHFNFIFKELKTNIPCLYSGLESLLSFSSCCTILPLSLCELIYQLLTNSLEYLGSCKDGIILLIRNFSSLIQIESFKNVICKNVEGRLDNLCILSQIISLFSKDDVVREDLIVHLLVLVSKLLQPPNYWLICSCSSNLLQILVKYLHYLTDFPFDSDGTTWKLLLFGIKVLHKWQLLDINWWEKIAPMPTYAVLMGTVHRRCKILKTTETLDQFIGEILYDLHGADET